MFEAAGCMLQAAACMLQAAGCMLHSSVLQMIATLQQCCSAPLGCNGRTRTGRVDALGERERILQQPSARTERVHDERESFGALDRIPCGRIPRTAVASRTAQQTTAFSTMW